MFYAFGKADSDNPKNFRLVRMLCRQTALDYLFGRHNPFAAYFNCIMLCVVVFCSWYYGTGGTCGLLTIVPLNFPPTIRTLNTETSSPISTIILKFEL